MSHFVNLHHCQLSQWIYEKRNRTQIRDGESLICHAAFSIAYLKLGDVLFFFFDRVVLFHFALGIGTSLIVFACDLWYHWGYQKIRINCDIADEKRLSGSFRVDRVTCQLTPFPSGSLPSATQFHYRNAFYSVRGKNCKVWTRLFRWNSMNETVQRLICSTKLSICHVNGISCDFRCICHGSMLLGCTWFNKRKREWRNHSRSLCVYKWTGHVKNAFYRLPHISPFFPLNSSTYSWGEIQIVHYLSSWIRLANLVLILAWIGCVCFSISMAYIHRHAINKYYMEISLWA